MAEKDGFRTEEDALGDVQVPTSHLWGAQTERSRENFSVHGHAFSPASGYVTSNVTVRAGAGLRADGRALVAGILATLHETSALGYARIATFIHPAAHAIGARRSPRGGVSSADHA